MSMRKFITIAAFLGLVCVLPTQARADFFSDAGSWVEDQYNSARDTAEDIAKAAEKAAQEVQKSAQYINDQATKQAEELTRQAAKGIEDAANYMGDFINNMTDLNKSCKDTLLSLEGSGGFIDGMPHLPKSLQSYPGVPAQLYSGSCEKYTINAFTCGIFPYLNGIAKAIASGDANVKKLAQYVDRAYGSSACKNAGPVDRPMCALIVGIAHAQEDNLSCAANVIADVVQSGNSSNNSIPADAEEKLCSMLGEFSFSFAADKLALGATSDLAMYKLLKFAQELRTSLKIRYELENSDRVKEVCSHGSKASHAGATHPYVAPLPTDTYTDIISDHPGRHLVLLKDLTSNMCLDGYGAHTDSDRQVQIYTCHGHDNQRWTFHKADGVKGNYYYVVNDRYQTCIEETPNGLVLKTCDQTRHEQLFKPRHAEKMVEKVGDDGTKSSAKVMKKTGTLQNLKSKNCIGVNTTALKNEIQLKGYDCNDKELNGVWYVNDPASNLLKKHPGAHLSVYSFPASPICIEARDGKAYMAGCDGNSAQLWSFHHVKDSRGEFDQLWNDHGGPNTCLHNAGPIGAPLTIKKCDSNYNEQLFILGKDGRMKNLHTGGCVEIYGEVHQIGKPISAWHCDDSDAQVWYKAERK